MGTCEVGTLFEMCRWGFSIFIVVCCFSSLFTGLKDMNEIDNIMNTKTKFIKLIERLFRSKKPAVIRRASYDQSTKEFEVLIITYRWDKYSRKLINEPKWHHYKYYKTLNSALDAARDIRSNWYYKDYPAMNGGIEQEQKYPHIKPTIVMHRYKAARRDDMPFS